ncbi:Hypothetical predicted protein [Lecanosticta acicola]|uniref:Uncharacterized protein n=1 Tax=Lecanosticta acicola TaxID=111012 RepID=A0AAI8YVB2_9PEZI|nr:Hypothetical predicted protein [Lecanosticta acicola]
MRMIDRHLPPGLQLLPEYQRQVLKWEVDTVNTTTYSRSAQEVMINLCGDLEFMTRALQERDEQLAEQERRIEKMEELAIIDMARLRAANEQIDELEAEVGELMGKLYEDDGSDGPEVYSDAVEEMKEESEELDQHEVRDKSEAGSEDSEQLKKLGEELEEVLRMAKKATLEEAAKK